MRCADNFDRARRGGESGEEVGIQRVGGASDERRQDRKTHLLSCCLFLLVTSALNLARRLSLAFLVMLERVELRRWTSLSARARNRGQRWVGECVCVGGGGV